MISGIGSKNSRGFSILEVLLVLLLLGLVMTMAIPTISTLSETEMNKEAHAIGSAVTDAYGRSALGSEPFRLVLDFEQNSYWIEGVAQPEEDDGGATISLSQLFGGEMPEDKEQPDRTSDTASNSLLVGPNFKPVDDDFGEKNKLSEDLSFWGVKIDPAEEWAKEGVVYLYFLPGGETQNAQIAIQKVDDDEDVLTLHVQGLTGLVHIESGVEAL